MAQIIGYKLLMFHVSAVVSSSTTAHDDGTNVDLGAFPATQIVAMMGSDDKVEISFADASQTDFYSGADGESILRTYVQVACTTGTEHKVIEDLWTLMNSVSAAPVIKFDAVNSVYPVENVTGITIRRAQLSQGISAD